jgi:hypothetical protein
MNRIIILFSFLILNLFFLDAISQKRLKYEGSFPTSLRQPAEVTYTYFIDKNGKKIKDGIFRYVVKVKETRNNVKIHHFVTIQGSYNKGLMDGSWDYRIMSRNYEKEKENYFYSEIQLEAKYKNGIPDGKWEYKADVKKRSIKENSSRVLWNPYEEIKNIEIMLNFKNGLLIDSLKIKSNENGEIEAFMNDKSVIDGVLKIYNKSFKYYQGFFITNNNSKELQAYKKYIANQNQDFHTDTLSLLNSTGSEIKKIINEEIFNEKNFLYSYLAENSNDNKSSCNKKDIYSGLFYINLKPKITEDFSSKAANIRHNSKRVKDHQEIFISKHGKYPEDREKRTELAKLQSYNKTLNSYTCLINHLSKEALVENAIKYSESQCKSDFSEFSDKTRDEIINDLNIKSEKLYQQALVIK